MLFRRTVVIQLLSNVIVAWLPMCYQAASELLAGRLTAATILAVATFMVMQTGGQVSAAEIPERLAPGVFDLIGATHQLMHVAMWAAHVLQYLFLWEMHTQTRPHSTHMPHHAS